jgi:hypothetical protein
MPGPGDLGRSGAIYQNIQVSGDSRAQLGDINISNAGKIIIGSDVGKSMS